jgi:hypothetical protein
MCTMDCWHRPFRILRFVSESCICSSLCQYRSLPLSKESVRVVQGLGWHHRRWRLRGEWIMKWKVYWNSSFWGASDPVPIRRIFSEYPIKDSRWDHGRLGRGHRWAPSASATGFGFGDALESSLQKKVEDAEAKAELNPFKVAPHLKKERLKGPARLVQSSEGKAHGRRERIGLCCACGPSSGKRAQPFLRSLKNRPIWGNSAASSGAHSRAGGPGQREIEGKDNGRVARQRRECPEKEEKRSQWFPPVCKHSDTLLRK